MRNKHTILYGNGLNRLTKGCRSWDDLLASINANPNKCDDFSKIPFTFQYEVLLPPNYYEESSEESAESIIKEKLSILLTEEARSNEFYKRLADLNASNYLTTNYEPILPNVFEEKGYQPKRDSPEIIYSIRRKTLIYKEGEIVSKIWNIHGELAQSKSLMLGLDHYCGSVGRIDLYVKGNYYRERYHRDAMEKRLLEG